MLNVADVAVGFLAPESKGTRDMMNRLIKNKTPLLIYKTDTGEIDIY
jgi:hypothetical protein